MKKVTKSFVYDTESSEVVSRKTYGTYGDPAGYEEVLYRTPEGKLFLYVNGGADSPYPEEQIICAPKALAAWKRENL